MQHTRGEADNDLPVDVHRLDDRGLPAGNWYKLPVIRGCLPTIRWVYFQSGLHAVLTQVSKWGPGYTLR
jgi:hypothetical protein